MRSEGIGYFLGHCSSDRHIANYVERQLLNELREEKKEPLKFSIDLLRFRPLRVLVRWGGFPYFFQVVMLAVFVAFSWISWGRFAPEGVADKLFAKTHLVQLVVWGLWWPGMVWAAVVLGRAWCAVCPLELVANVTERLGRWLGIPQRDLGRRLSSGVLVLVLYAAIQLLVAGVHFASGSGLYIHLSASPPRLGRCSGSHLATSCFLSRFLSGRPPARHLWQREHVSGAQWRLGLLRELHRKRLRTRLQPRPPRQS